MPYDFFIIIYLYHNLYLYYISRLHLFVLINHKISHAQFIMEHLLL